MSDSYILQVVGHEAKYQQAMMASALAESRTRINMLSLAAGVPVQVTPQVQEETETCARRPVTRSMRVTVTEPIDANPSTHWCQHSCKIRE